MSASEERCPSCGSDDRKVRRLVAAEAYPEVDGHGQVPCRDRWHPTFADSSGVAETNARCPSCGSDDPRDFDYPCYERRGLPTLAAWHVSPKEGQ